MFKKELSIIFIGLCIVVAVLVLGWNVFVKQELSAPVKPPVIMDDNNQNNGRDEVVDDSSDVEDNIVDDNDISEIDASDWKTYQNEELGFEFKYPTEWENLFESEEDFLDANALYPSRIRVGVGNLEDNLIILEADNGGDRMGRGGFTGDIVIDVNSQEYIKNFCQKNKDVSKCEYKTNLNNINFVKYEDELCAERGCFGKGLFYLTYNPNSEYRGVLLYTYNIQKDKTVPNSEEEIIFDSLVDSLEFTKQ